MTYILGGTSVASFIGTLLWKPQTKLLTTYTELNRAAALAMSTEMLCNSIEKVSNEKVRAHLATEAIDQISKAMRRTK